MLPGAASVSNAAIEDAAILSECVSALPLKDAIQAYQSIRKRRNDRIWEISLISQRNVSAYTSTSSYESTAALRDERLKEATRELAESLKLSSVERKLLQTSRMEDDAAVFPSPALTKWLYGYDAIAIVSSITLYVEHRLKDTESKLYHVESSNDLIIAIGILLIGKSPAACLVKLYHE
ncbi:hypothetical protein M409DRAFT_23601 [Zasmidium cellare ATCC 36951]|uniref:Uncharacterized protein n=1 Tax=Zasmidium cellare ATCC 36951 TaxID=1080233 RepID=A0A6A6CJI5_ZASCE|nr:uncharacterized protein M409DRAFT_23601 [Zasmidium cellare ATCC 36951]KAF2165869.1 hypothetical protein M409DRAFT_23601 [Zasmidium cellare ATCC 36951]